MESVESASSHSDAPVVSGQNSLVEPSSNPDGVAYSSEFAELE